MAVIGYDFYINGVKDNITPAPETYTFDGLASDTAYNITAVAIDGAGNRSTTSSVLTASTSVVAPPPEDSPLSGADMAAVDAIVAPMIGTGKAPGVIISITGPRGFYSKAYGKVTAAASARLLTTDDHFRMASVTKTFTGTAFWLAVDQGLVSLDDTLEQYVPGVPEGDVITMRDLLGMRAGVYDFTSNLAVLAQILFFPTGPYSEAQALNLIKSNPSQYPPGSQYRYNNSDAILIGAVVEAVTGRDLRVVFREDIFEPLGLTETAWPPDVTIPVPAASTVQYNPEITGAAGCLTTTIGDLTKWAQAMRDGTLISSESQDVRTNTFPSTGIASPGAHPPNAFAYGYFMFSFGSWIGHDGGITGSSTACAFDSVSGATITVAVNNANATAFYTILRNIAALLYPDSVLDPDYTATVVRPASAQLTLSGGTPDVRLVALGAVFPTSASLSITGGTPTIVLSDNKIVTPTGASLSVTGSEPGVNVIAVGAILPTAASLTITGGTPTVEVSDNKTVTPTRALLTVTGGTPAVVAPVTPSGATLTVTGGTPTVTVATAFTPFSIENTDVAAGTSVPAGATEWRYRGLGAGGGGGGARKSVSGTTRRGGGGGGGGALVYTGWQSVALLGPTYSVTRGLGGAGGATPTTGDGTAGTSGGASSFVSGSVSLSAGGGEGAPGSTSTNAFNGDGGTVSVSGVSATSANGTAGGTNNTAGAGAGGGKGQGLSSSNLTLSATAGGNTTTGTGGAAAASGQNGGDGPDQSAGNPGPGGGGAANGIGFHGGAGGDFGGGGGGAGTITTTGTNTAGPGGDGYTLLEWQ